MASGGPPREYAAALGATMIDPTAGHGSHMSPGLALLSEQWKPGWRSWLLVAIGVALGLAVLALLYGLP